MDCEIHLVVFMIDRTQTYHGNSAMKNKWDETPSHWYICI